MKINLTLKDLASMRLPLAVLAIVLLVSAAFIKISSAQHNAAEAQRRAQATALEDARLRYQHSGEEREAILRYLPAYRQLERQGFVGTEQRINWIEGLRAANKQAGLFGVAYQIDARKPFELVGQENPISQHLHHSPMKLSFGLVHEGDLMRFLETLAAQQTGMFFVTDCAIDRMARQETPAPRRPNLNAQCGLSWLTLDPGRTGS